MTVNSGGVVSAGWQIFIRAIYLRLIMQAWIVAAACV